MTRKKNRAQFRTIWVVLSRHSMKTMETTSSSQLFPSSRLHFLFASDNNLLILIDFSRHKTNKFVMLWVLHVAADRFVLLFCFSGYHCIHHQLCATPFTIALQFNWVARLVCAMCPLSPSIDSTSQRDDQWSDTKFVFGLTLVVGVAHSFFTIFFSAHFSKSRTLRVAMKSMAEC